MFNLNRSTQLGGGDARLTSQTEGNLSTLPTHRLLSARLRSAPLGGSTRTKVQQRSSLRHQNRRLSARPSQQPVRACGESHGSLLLCGETRQRSGMAASSARLPGGGSPPSAAGPVWVGGVGGVGGRSTGSQEGVEVAETCRTAEREFGRSSFRSARQGEKWPISRNHCLMRTCTGWKLKISFHLSSSSREKKLLQIIHVNNRTDKL